MFVRNSIIDTTPACGSPLRASRRMPRIPNMLHSSDYVTTRDRESNESKLEMQVQVPLDMKGNMSICLYLNSA